MDRHKLAIDTALDGALRALETAIDDAGLDSERQMHLQNAYDVVEQAAYDVTDAYDASNSPGTARAGTPTEHALCVLTELSAVLRNHVQADDGRRIAAGVDALAAMIEATA